MNKRTAADRLHHARVLYHRARVVRIGKTTATMRGKWSEKK